MPIVNDRPETIYVRDISEFEAESFEKIKKQFNISSNGEVVKRLFSQFLELQEESDKLKKDYSKLQEKNRTSLEKLSTIKETFKMINKL